MWEDREIVSWKKVSISSECSIISKIICDKMWNYSVCYFLDVKEPTNMLVITSYHENSNCRRKRRTMLSIALSQIICPYCKLLAIMREIYVKIIIFVKFWSKLLCYQLYLWSSERKKWYRSHCMAHTYIKLDVILFVFVCIFVLIFYTCLVDMLWHLLVTITRF